MPEGHRRPVHGVVERGHPLILQRLQDMSADGLLGDLEAQRLADCE
jgi:hypothetical protein